MLRDSTEKEDVEKKLLKKMAAIVPLDQQAMEKAVDRWNSIGKPIHSLGLLEDAIVRMAGIQGTDAVRMDKKAIVVMCADNGVVREGVTQTGSQVTRIVADNIACGDATVDIMANKAGADVFVVDIGMDCEEYPQKELCTGKVIDRKIRRGSGDIALEPAMTCQECMQALLTGMEIAQTLKEKGYHVIGTGEMGIGNTTPASALASILDNVPAENVTGKGAGLTEEGLRHKIGIVEKAVNRYWDAAGEIADDDLFRFHTGVELLAQVGSLEIAGMAGLCLGGAASGLTVILDGFISAAAALAAILISTSQACGDYLLASHVSAEPGGKRVISQLHVSPVIDAGMCLGEGTGAAAAMSLYEMALEVYRSMKTFEEINVTPYKA